MPGEIIVLVTCPEAESEKIARSLLEKKLAACVNVIGQMRSIYIWDGKIQNEPENLLVIKSTRAVWDRLKEHVKAVHSYEVPEIICLPIEAGDKPYLDWLSGAVTSEQ